MQPPMDMDRYTSCIQACMACAAACDRCFGEPDVDMMRDRMTLDVDCADACRLAAAVMAWGGQLAPAVCALCARMCDACGTECARHGQVHCQDCARVCELCAKACRAMAD